MYSTLGRITWNFQYVALYLRPVRHRCGVYVGPHVVENRGGQNITRHRRKHTTSLSQSQTSHHNPKVCKKSMVWEAFADLCPLTSQMDYTWLTHCNLQCIFTIHPTVFFTRALTSQVAIVIILNQLFPPFHMWNKSEQL